MFIQLLSCYCDFSVEIFDKSNVCIILIMLDKCKNKSYHYIQPLSLQCYGECLVQLFSYIKSCNLSIPLLLGCGMYFLSPAILSFLSIFTPFLIFISNYFFFFFLLPSLISLTCSVFLFKSNEKQKQWYQEVSSMYFLLKIVLK